MKPEDKIRILQEGLKTPFWQLISAELDFGIRELKNSLMTCDLDEVISIRERVKALEMIKDAPNLIMAENLDEIAIKKAEEEQDAAQRDLFHGKQ
jgi:hypothetical protein